MHQADLDRRTLFLGSAAVAAAVIPFLRTAAAQAGAGERRPAAIGTTLTLKRAATPAWLLAMWKEIDDKTFGHGFDCFTTDAICNLGVADWHGREAIRANLRAFIDKGMTTRHDVVEYWDAGPFKVFHGTVTMKFDTGTAAFGGAGVGFPRRHTPSVALLLQAFRWNVLGIIPSRSRG